VDGFGGVRSVDVVLEGPEPAEVPVEGGIDGRDGEDGKRDVLEERVLEDGKGFGSVAVQQRIRKLE
jgi:hypothetical protein